MAYGAKTKVKKKEKKMKGEKCSVCGDSQHKVPKVVENYKKGTERKICGKIKQKRGKIGGNLLIW